MRTRPALWPASTVWPLKNCRVGPGRPSSSTMPAPTPASSPSSPAARSEIRLIHHAHNQGFAAAVNAAAAKVDHGDLLLLNADTLLPPGALERLLAATAT